MWGKIVWQIAERHGGRSLQRYTRLAFNSASE
jgi:hypothetical protein